MNQVKTSMEPNNNPQRQESQHMIYIAKKFAREFNLAVTGLAKTLQTIFSLTVIQFLVGVVNMLL